MIFSYRPDQITIPKQPKADDYWLDKPVLTYTFERPEVVNDNIRAKVQFLLSFTSKIKNMLQQLLNKVAID